MEKTKVISRYLNINTKFRPFIKNKQQPSNDFFITLPNTVKNVVAMKLIDINIPDLEYTFSVNQNNNSFHIFNRNNNNTTLITVPDRSYDDKEELITQVNELIKAKLPLLGHDGHDGHDTWVNTCTDEINDCTWNDNILNMISLKYDDELKKFYFQTDGTFELNFDTNNNYIFNTFGWILGFQKSIYGVEDLDKDDRYYAENPVNMPNTTPYYLLYINDFTNNVYDTFTEGCFPSNNTVSSILTKVNTRFSEENNTLFISGTEEECFRQYSSPVNLDKLHIKLLDENQNLVHLNNCNWNFLLKLEVVE